MIINTPISLGELLDRISILKIKDKNISDSEKRKLVKNELDLLKETLNKNIKNEEEILNYIEDLLKVNSKLWKIEDDLRECERNKKFDEKFIELARSVYFTNDERANIKREINISSNSKFIEVKSYKNY